MEKRTLGKTGLQVSILGVGGAEIDEDVTPEAVERILGDALDAGLNVIDTAECYTNGEDMIGRAVSSRRSEYYLFTKCGHADGLDLPDWTPELLRQSVDRSLRRLRTDYLDLLQLHTCSEDKLRRGDVIEVLVRAREAGKTRYIGYSGDSHAALYAVNCGAFDTLQTSVNITDQEAIDLTLPRALERGMGVIAKRPIANVVWKNAARPDDPSLHIYWDRLKQLDYEFLKEDLSTTVNVSLRFTFSVPGIHTAIVGTAKPGRCSENAKIVSEGILPEEQYQAIRERWKAVAGADWSGQD